MRYTNKLLVLGFLLATFISCVEPYDVRSISFDRAIVVDGRFTNEPESNYVKLSFTRPVGENKNVPLTNARVWLEGTDGSKFEFTESAPGFYLNSEGMAGDAGISYQLFFTTSEGRQYQSSNQELIASPPIDSIYHRYAEKPSSTSVEIYKGINFFIDTHDETNKAQYYKYEWEETYEVQAPFPSLYEFYTDPDTVIFRTEQVNVCFASAKSASIIIGTTANLTQSKLSEMEIRYITNETDHLKYAYSILVKQYVINSDAYGFYREFLENNKNNESLFDKQLGVIVGNVHSVEDPGETVLGYFEVSGVREKRAFVKFKDLDSRFPWPEPQYPCAPNQIVTIIDSVQPLPYKLKDSVSYYVRQGNELYIAAYCDKFSDPKAPCSYYFSGKLVPKYCGDCRFRGPATKPEFWIY